MRSPHSIRFYRLLFYLLITVLFTISIGVLTPAADVPSSPINIDANFDKNAVTTGDTLTFTVSITTDPDIELHPPDFDSHLTMFEILDNAIKDPEKDGDQIKTEIWYRLKADETGKYIIPSVIVTFLAPDPKYPDKKIQGQILTPEVKIDVLSVLRRQGEPKDIKDIKPILEFDPDWKEYILYVFLVVLILVLFFIWAGKNKRPRNTKNRPELPTLLSHELAFKELNVLQTKDLLKQGMYREHYFELSEIFRRYLGTRFCFPALDWTTEEIIRWMERSNLLTDSSKVRMWNILNNADQVKYAKVQPSDYASESIMESSIQFIKETLERPQPKEPQRQGAI